jgi:type I restriction enzyme S subunit
MKQDWEIKELGEVANFSQGIQVGLEQHLTYPKEGYVRFIRIVDYTQNTDDIRYVPNPGEKYFVNEDDIVMVRYGTPGLIGRGKAGVIANNLFKIKIERKDLINYYLTLFLSQDYIQNYLSTQGSATMPALNFGQLKTVKIRFPPIQEQQRIVDILDEAFTAIAKVKNNAEQNLKNTKELFENYLQDVFENKGEGWEEKQLKDITNKIGSGATPRGGNESYKSEGISLVRSMNVHDLEFRNKNLAFIDEQQAKELNNVTLQENDVLLNITGASVARCCLIPTEQLPARVNQHVSIIRAQKDKINPIFLNYLLTSKFYKDQLLLTGEQGATRQAITKVQLEVFKIAFPKSLKEQNNIVQKLNALKTETQKLEANYNQKINDLEELKKSILQKAFNGELKTATELV